MLWLLLLEVLFAHPNGIYKRSITNNTGNYFSNLQSASTKTGMDFGLSLRKMQFSLTGLSPTNIINYANGNIQDPLETYQVMNE